MERATGRVDARVGGLQQRLDESEAARRRAEGQLQQALATLAVHGYKVPSSEPGAVAEVAPAPAIRTPEPEPVVEVPAPQPEPEPVVEVPAPQPEPEPVVEVPEPEPVVEVPVPVVKTPAEPKRVRRPGPTPEPAVAAEAEPEPVVAAEPEPAEPEPWPEVVVVPDLQPATSRSEAESAVDVLDRLVEPVGQHTN